MALDKVKQGVIADDAVGSAQISPNALADVDIAPDSIGTSELKNDAVETANIKDSTGASDGITTAKLASNAVTTAKITDANITAGKLHADITAGKVITTEVKPHIIPGVLYPSYVASGTSNKLLDGTTDHSGAFGTAQSDGRKYYYTNIAGSKPIKDPRVGAHFGSQRHMFKSIQQLEQETATHGDDVYSIDGREWMRGVGALEYVNDTRNIQLKLESATTSFFEITGYFSAFNFLNFSSDTARNLKVELDGVTAHATFNPNGAVNSPLGSRYVSAGSVFNVDLTASGSSLSSDTLLGIHTIRISYASGHVNYPTGCELIAQDTTSTANLSKIQIPTQNVVSHGKKFEVGGTSAATHYDPFTTMSYGGSGTTLSNLQSLIDTDTSLGMDAWKAGTSNYHRPWNGGRVIKWVDSSGTIKTSVNMMPPNAQNIGTTASNAVSDAHVIAGTNDDTINFNTSAVDHSQAEVAKTWNCYEFGNGNANGGHDGPYKDATQLDASGFDDIGYVMDDGLSSLVIDNARQYDLGEGIYLEASKAGYITFIGTGISIYSSNSGVEETKHIAQNLPYGTHILKIATEASHNVTTLTLDGVQLNSSATHFVYAHFEDITFHQPKRPPIPEDCVVLCDYMLMADFVSQTTGGIGLISKGVRSNSVSRDVFSNIPSSAAFDLMYPKYNQHQGFRISTNSTGSSDTDHTFRLPSFGTTYLVRAYHFDDRHKLFVDTTEKAHTHNGTDYESFGRLSTALDLGVHKFGVNAKQNKNPNISAFEVVTPIHTSSHYQTFESPFLHELVGGDRNMEQTNLVCSPDGKTWDEITRDTSYISNSRFLASRDGGDFTGAGQAYIYDYFRGNLNHSGAPHSAMQKNFAICLDRIICLVEGHYKVTTQNFSADADRQVQVMKNSVIDANDRCIAFGRTDTADFTIALTANTFLKRGDFIGVRFDGATFRGALKHFTFIAIEKI